MVVKTAAELTALATRILVAAGASDENAARVADHLVASNVSGVDTHGVWNLPGYVAGIRAGDLLPTSRPAVLRESPASVLVTGNWGFGHVAARFAMRLAIEKARTQQLAAAGIVQVHHIGRVGEYAEMAAAAGLIALVAGSGYAEEQPRCAPFGGRGRVLDTNPLAMGFPAGSEPPLMFDYATTATSGIKVVLARDRKHPLPPGCVIDTDGRPSTDPTAFFDGGAFLPFGGHKGYAIMMAVEYLGRILTGADAYADPARGGATFRHQGVSMLVLRADLFRPLADFTRQADEMARRVRAVPPAPGVTEVLVPGDPESRTRAIRLRDGVPIPEDTWRSIQGVAASLGVTDL